MAKYVLVYHGGGMPQTDAEREAVMAAWGAWLGSLDGALLDGGNPFGPSAAVAADGSTSEGAPSGLTGYSILSAGSLGEATEQAKGCPILASGGRVEVYETFEVM
jgi:hypothetical protein